MGTITVGVRVDHLGSPSFGPTSTPPALSSAVVAVEQPRSRVLLATNLPHTATITSTLKAFVRDYLRVPEERQRLTAPAFTKLQDCKPVEEIYKKYSCQADRDDCDLYVDEDALTFFVRECGRMVELGDHGSLSEYNILDRSVIHLQKAPQLLPLTGGRLFVETKDGIVPLLGISGLTRVSALKEAIHKHTGIPTSQQLLSSLGRIMHDDFCVRDFDGIHTIYEDSTIDLTRSGDKNADQWHRRMVINISVVGEQDFELLVQGRDLVQTVMNVVEQRTGVPPWQQKLRFAGKLLEEKKALGEYFVSPQSTLQVSLFRHSLKSSFKSGTSLHSSENAADAGYTPAARKIKMVRTCKGTVVGPLTIPVLTTDTIGDLRRKVKHSLRPIVEPVMATPPRPRAAESVVAYKLPPPPLPSSSPATPPSGYETPRAKLGSTPRTPSFETPRPKLFSPGTSSCETPRTPSFETPRAKLFSPESTGTPSFETPRAKLFSPSHEATRTPSYETPRAKLFSPGTPSRTPSHEALRPQLLSPGTTPRSSAPPPMTRSKLRHSGTELGSPEPSRKPSKLGSARRLKLGAEEKIGSPQRILSTLDENALSYCQASVQDKINKALVHIVHASESNRTSSSTSSSSGSANLAASIEKKGLGAWLKQMKAGFH